MGRFVKGDVIVIPFPFSDLSASKKRPALVVAVVEPFEDVILCMITSRGATDQSAIPIDISDFATGKLPRESNVRPNRLFTASPNIILDTTGSLTTTKTDEVISAIIRILSK
ncbi:MAG: type II toxin-antitoxin system PemK/MazF family toxin [Caldilineales bacterium]|nr:type II toxin-antitoxin system PemK/MazF family toxin [Caldilineales bacterium]